MKLWFVVAAAWLAVVGPSSARADDLAARMDAYMRARADLGQFSGSVAVMRGGEMLFEQAYGPADLQGRANTVDTLFQAASITKPVTALAVLKLRREGRLALTDSVCRFLSPCPDAWRPVTIEQLMRHTSGVPDYEAALEMGSPTWTEMMRRPDSAAAIIDWARRRPLDFPPGERFAYSNTGYVLLAAVAATAAGRPYEAWAREQVLDAAGLRTARLGGEGAGTERVALGLTGTDEPSSEALAAGRALDGGWLKTVPGVLPGVNHGDAALLTTAGDLARFGSRVAGLLGPDDLALTLRDDTGEGYGLGWELPGGGTMAHNGVLPGFVSRLTVDPAHDLTVAVVANFDGARFDAVARDLALIAEGQPYEAPRSHRIVDLNPEWTAGLVGAWSMGGLPVTLEVRDGRLTLAAQGRFNAGLLPEGPDVWYAPLFEGVVRFERNASGRATGFTLRFRGQDHPAVRREESGAT